MSWHRSERVINVDLTVLASEQGSTVTPEARTVADRDLHQGVFVSVEHFPKWLPEISVASLPFARRPCIRRKIRGIQESREHAAQAL